MENDYEPFGYKWRQEMMKLPKAKLILMLKDAYKSSQYNSDEKDPMPNELDFYTGAADASGEVYDQFLHSEYEHALNEWKKRKLAKSIEQITEEQLIKAFKAGHDSARLKGSYKRDGTYDEDLVAHLKSVKFKTK